jgi:predicted RNase H-like nuclease (RuvC/YqgF family)
MKSTVKTVKGRGRPKGSKNVIKTTKPEVINQWIGYEKEIERKDHTLEIMRDEIKDLEKYLADQKEKNAFLELDISHLKDIIRRLVEHL